MPGTLDDDVVAACARLIRFDTTNFGGGDAAAGAAGGRVGRDPALRRRLRPAGARVEPRPGEHRGAHPGPRPQRAGPARARPPRRRARRRAGLATRPVRRRGRRRPVRPSVWGRGALDMKDMDAMLLAVALRLRPRRVRARRATSCSRSSPTRRTPARTARGSSPPSTPTCSRASPRRSASPAVHRIVLPDGAHLYPVATCERGTAWMRLTARGTAGHGSRPAARQRDRHAGPGRSPASPTTDGRPGSSRPSGRCSTAPPRSSASPPTPTTPRCSTRSATSPA